MSLEEKIKQLFAEEYYPDVPHKWKKWKHDGLREEHMKSLEKEVLQILKEQVIPCHCGKRRAVHCTICRDRFARNSVKDAIKENEKKWGELLKLWKTRPFTDFVPLDNLSSECKECINNVLEWYRKIEEKLKEMNK